MAPPGVCECVRESHGMALIHKATANTLTTQYMVRFSHLTVQLPTEKEKEKTGL